VVVVIATLTGGQVARGLLLFGAAEPGNVHVGTPSVRYERNPDMLDRCRCVP
jgi:hypothetical protein